MARRRVTPPSPTTPAQAPSRLPAHRRVTYAAETGPGWFEDAYCDEVDCGRWRNGFKVVVDLTTDLGRRQDDYLSRDRARDSVRRRTEFGAEYVYPPGTPCFEAHQRRLERPPLYVVRGGDSRGNPTGKRRVHANVDDWVEDFAEHQSKLADATR